MSQLRPSTSFTLERIPVNIKKAEYAVRGTLVIKALQYADEIIAAKEKNIPNPHPFEEIIFCNIGNPQALNQPPISFFRQVIACMECPELMDHEPPLFPPDVFLRAKKYLEACNCRGGTGAYSHSQGIEKIRQEVADFIERRDGFASDRDNIFLTDGASKGVQAILSCLVEAPSDGIMVSIPQYPLYSATLSLLGGTLMPYYLDESLDWGLSLEELNRSYDEGVANGVVCRALCIINPGNPTGSVLSKANMKEVINFCIDKNIVLLADEVYQENIYTPEHRFHSFKKVVMEMGIQHTKKLELVSFHSISKGLVGECGKRGGYFELFNIDKEAQAMVYKLASISLCPNVVGQMFCGMMCNPPQEGDPSFPKYNEECQGLFSSLQRRAQKLGNALNTLTNVKCNLIEGAMYAFPMINIPQKACEEARRQNLYPDLFYCLELLCGTGVCVIPGSGFGQEEGTFHFRTTFLPLEEQIDGVIEKVSAWHEQFMKLYE